MLKIEVNMSKTSMCLEMLQILNSRGIVQINELADLLQTNPRNILEYKKELEYAGYYIDTIPGRYGGYVLNRRYLLPVVQLTETEREALTEASDYLRSRNDFLKIATLNRALSKIFSSITHEESESKMTVINRFPLVMSEEELLTRYETIQTAILNCSMLSIIYESLTNKIRTHKIHPYHLYMYNNTWFLLAWTEEKHDYGYFKLNRMKNIEVLKENFIRDPYFKLSNYLDDFGMKNNGEWYHIKFVAYDQYALLVKERIYGRNQIVEAFETSTQVSVDMQNKDYIIVFILGFGPHVKVLEPQWLVDELMVYVDQIKTIYKTNDFQ